MKKTKELSEMTFEEFNKNIIFYEYKSKAWRVNYHYICIGAKNNENFKYDMKKVKEIRSKNPASFILDKEYKYHIGEMEKRSIYFGSFDKTFKPRIYYVEIAYLKMKNQTLISQLKNLITHLK